MAVITELLTYPHRSKTRQFQQLQARPEQKLDKLIPRAEPFRCQTILLPFIYLLFLCILKWLDP
jgi:hypothetical protein